MVEKTGTVIGNRLPFQFGTPHGWDNTALLGLDPDDPDVRAILENDYIKNLLSSLRSYDTPGAPLTPEVNALRQLDAEASSDLSWWQQFFNPTFDLDAQRFELSPLGSFLLEHPEFLLGSASLARHAVKTAACVALQRVAPKLLAASGAALAWENFVSFMKGGKNAVKKTTAGEAKTQKIDDDLKKYMDYAKHKGAGYTNNLNNKLRLDAELAFKQAGILDDFGKLTAKAVQNAKRINLAEGEVKNKAVRKILTKDGSKITDWVKFTTESVKLGNGQKKQIHFYKNLKNGKVDYETVDYKIKGDVAIAKGVK